MLVKHAAIYQHDRLIGNDVSAELDEQRRTGDKGV